MTRFLAAFLLLMAFFPAQALTQETRPQTVGFLHYGDVVPTEIVLMDNERGRVTQTLVSVDTLFFGNFTPGRSDDLSDAQIARFDSVVASLDDSQHLFFRGTADTLRWTGKYSSAESPRLNRSLAETRALWALERAGKGRLLHAVINHTGRGVIVYVATYEDVEDALARAIADLPRVVDTLVIVQQLQPHVIATTFLIEDTTKEFRAAVGAGYEGVFVDSFDFNVPTLQLAVLLRQKVRFTLTGGYRPKDASDNPEEVPGDRNETLLAVNAEWYPWNTWLGLAAGHLWAYENNRKTDEFLERAYGLTVGPRARLLNDVLVLGLDLGYFDISKFGEDSSRRHLGVAPSVRLHYTF